MPTSTRSLILAASLVTTLAGAAAAQELRPEWSVEPASGGRAHVVGYLYNGNIRDAANVQLRVDRLGGGGAVTASYRGRVVGDVLSGGRSLFDVPVGEAGASYRVEVVNVDWVKECR